MGLLDAFTGAPAKKAAQQQRDYLGNVQTQGMADIGQGYNTATGAVTAGTNAGQAALTGGYNDAQGFANQGVNGALGYIDQGTTGAMGRVDQAAGAYAPLSALGTKYGGGTNLYLDSLGVNGAEGNTRATSAFQPSGAYGFNLDQGLEAINRRRNAGGMLNSGNADRDAQEYGAGLASREYGGWQDRLAGLINPELSATSGAASGIGGANLAGANILNQGGIAKAGIEGNRGAMLADLAKWYGGAGAGLETGQGNTLAGLATGAAGQKVGLATGLAPGYSQTYGNEAQAAMGGSANLWNLGLNAAKLGTQYYGGQAGGAAAPGQWNQGQTFLSQMGPGRA